MTTLQEFTAIKLAAVHGLPFDKAREIVEREAAGWQLAGIPLPWGEKIERATPKVKALAW